MVKTVRQFILKLNILLSFDPVILLLNVSRDIFVCAYVHKKGHV